VAQSGADDKTKCDGPGNPHEQGRGLSKYPSEAAHILDGLLHHECSLEIREHYTDTAGAIDHVFGLCHLLGFRFAPRIRDLADRRLFVADGRAVYTALNPMIGGTLDFRGISFLVWEIHKPIAGVVGSNVGALQPGKVDNQCVEKIPLLGLYAQTLENSVRQFANNISGSNRIESII